MTHHNTLISSAILFSLAGCAALPGSEEGPTTGQVPDPMVSVETWTSPEEGFFTNSHWIDTGKEVIVFDAQFTPQAAELVLREIRSATDSPVRYVIVTHPNPDKFNGASVFQEAGAQLVASRATSEAMPGVHAHKKAYFIGAGTFTEDTYPRLPAVDLVFDERLALDLEASTEIELQVLTHPGVSSSQTVAWIKDANALVVGDLIHPGVHAWLEGGIVDGAAQPDLSKWQLALAELSPYGAATVYAGRGAAVPLQSAISGQQHYLSEVDDIVRRWGIDVASERADGADLDELAGRIHAAFPDYAMGFLTNYSIYALAAAALRSQ